MPAKKLWEALDVAFRSGAAALYGTTGFSVGATIAEEIKTLRLVERAASYGINRGFSEIAPALHALLDTLESIKNNKSMIPGLSGTAEVKKRYEGAKAALLPLLVTDTYGFRSDVLTYVEHAKINAKRIKDGCELSTKATEPIAEESLKLLSEIEALAMSAPDESSEAALLSAASVLAGIRRWNNITMLDALEMGEGSVSEAVAPLREARAAAERWSKLYVGVTKANPIAKPGISPKYMEKFDALAYAAGVAEV